MYLDLHVHLLPGVDDGAADLEESVDIARALVSRGFTSVVATPHIASDLFPNEPGRLRDAASALADVLSARDVELEVLPGAEHYLDESSLELIVSGKGLPLSGRGNAYLVEVAMDGPLPHLGAQIFRLRLAGSTPVIAHPERCAVFRDVELARRLVDSGAHLQLNLGSLAGVFGRRVASLSKRLLDEGLYSFAASDLHDAECAEEALGIWIESLERAAGSEGRDLLLGTNPRRLMAGEPVTPFEVRR